VAPAWFFVVYAGTTWAFRGHGGRNVVQSQWADLKETGAELGSNVQKSLFVVGAGG
jgi:hypothetical protein